MEIEKQKMEMVRGKWQREIEIVREKEERELESRERIEIGRIRAQNKLMKHSVTF